MGRRKVWLGLALPVLLTGQQIRLTTGPWGGLAENEQDCSVQGRVQSIRITRSEIEDDGHQGARQATAKCIFDRKGRIFDYWQYSDYGNGKHTQRTLSLFDSRNRPVEVDDFDMNKDPKRPQRLLVKWDAKDRELETRSIDSDGSVNYWVSVEYDSQKDTVKQTHHDGSTGKIRSTTIRQYDTSHHLIHEEIRNINPDTESKETFRNNDAGQRIEAFYGEGESARYIYAYDEHGRLSSETVTGPIPTRTGNAHGFCGDCGAFLGKTTYRYDDNGLITEERTIQPGNILVGLSRYAYDGHGNHTRLWVYRANPSDKRPSKFRAQVDGEDLLFNWTNGLRSISYTYDSHGNWIKAVETQLSSNIDADSGRVISSITYRSIRYR